MVKDSWLPLGYPLFGDIITGPVICEGDGYQIISVRGSAHSALLATEEYSDYWKKDGLLTAGEAREAKFGDLKFSVITSDERTLSPLSACPSPETKSEVLAFASSVARTRERGVAVSLSNSIYCERLGLLLPMWDLADAPADDVLLGQYITGGVPLSIFSVRRLLNLQPWLSEEDLADVSKAAGLKIAEKVSDTEDAGVSKKGPFTLVGRPALEAFFREHIIDIIENAERYRSLGIEFPSAVVLHGPPGCGKTFAVERLVEYLDWPSFTVDSTSVGSPYIHETGRKIAEVFNNAVNSAPSIIIIDEMEAFLSDRQMGGGSGTHRIEEVAEFLRRIPEAQKSHVLVFGMTNRLEMIDPAILRRGRFDHVIEVNMATGIEIESLLRKLLFERPCETDLPINEVANQLAGRPLSDVAFVVREASRIAAKAGNDKLDTHSLLTAIQAAAIKGPPDKSKKIGF
jgi:cell division protease FtsH